MSDDSRSNMEWGLETSYGSSINQTALIRGIWIVGVIVLILLCIVCFCCCVRRRRRLAAVAVNTPEPPIQEEPYQILQMFRSKNGYSDLVKTNQHGTTGYGAVVPDPVYDSIKSTQGDKTESGDYLEPMKTRGHGSSLNRGASIRFSASGNYIEPVRTKTESSVQPSTVYMENDPYTSEHVYESILTSSQTKILDGSGDYDSVK